jgi:hypothetical protein
MYNPNGFIFRICAGLAEYGCEWIVVQGTDKEEALKKLEKWCKDNYDDYNLVRYEMENQLPREVYQGEQVTII